LSESDGILSLVDLKTQTMIAGKNMPNVDVDEVWQLLAYEEDLRPQS